MKEDDDDFNPPCEYCGGSGNDDQPKDCGEFEDCWHCDGSGLGPSKRQERYDAYVDWNFGRV